MVKSEYVSLKRSGLPETCKNQKSFIVFTSHCVKVKKTVPSVAEDCNHVARSGHNSSWVDPIYGKFDWASKWGNRCPDWNGYRKCGWKNWGVDYPVRTIENRLRVAREKTNKSNNANNTVVAFDAVNVVNAFTVLVSAIVAGIFVFTSGTMF